MTIGDRPLRRVVAPFPEVEVVAPWLLRMPLRTPTLPPATTTNHYVLGDEELLLIDPATPHRTAQTRLVALLEAMIATGSRLVGLFLTHHHNDHIGAVTALADRFEVPVLAHAETARLLRGQIAVDRLVEDEDDVLTCRDGRTWRALFTPGHAPGHLVLYDMGSGMIAGDMVAGEGTIVVDPDEGSMADYLASLARMRALDPAWLAPAHGQVIHDADALLAHYIAHRQQREQRVMHALTADWQADDALLPSAYGDVARLLWPFALRSLRAHLIHLAEQGLAQRQGDRWRLM